MSTIDATALPSRYCPECAQMQPTRGVICLVCNGVALYLSRDEYLQYIVLDIIDRLKLFPQAQMTIWQENGKIHSTLAKVY